MKKRLLSALLAFCMVLTLFPATAFAVEGAVKWDGVSVETDWYTNNKGASSYTISTAAELAGLATLVNDEFIMFAGKTINLVTDIDLNNQPWSAIGYGWSGTLGSAQFRGNFNGNNHLISNLYVNVTSEPAGLFGQISRGTIQDLNVTGNVNSHFDSNIAYTVYGTGGIVASTTDTNTIQNCSFAGSVTGYSNVGGIVGSNRGSVRNCSNSASVTAEQQTSGGIAGSNSGTIELCHNTGLVSTISRSAGGSAGGISGSSGGSIYQCYNTGNIQGNHSTGGLVGSSGSVVISDCYNTGSVSINSGHSGCGGIVGRIGNFETTTIQNCYNIGSLSGDIYRHAIAGGPAENAIVNSCFNLPLDGPYDTGGTPITAEQFAQQSIFEGWDFGTIWEMSANLRRPVLKNNPEANGSIPVDPDPVEPSGLAVQEGVGSLLQLRAKETRNLSFTPKNNGIYIFSFVGTDYFDNQGFGATSDYFKIADVGGSELDYIYVPISEQNYPNWDVSYLGTSANSYIVALQKGTTYSVQYHNPENNPDELVVVASPINDTYGSSSAPVEIPGATVWNNETLEYYNSYNYTDASGKLDPTKNYTNYVGHGVLNIKIAHDGWYSFGNGSRDLSDFGGEGGIWFYTRTLHPLAERNFQMNYGDDGAEYRVAAAIYLAAGEYTLVISDGAITGVSNEVVGVHSSFAKANVNVPIIFNTASTENYVTFTPAETGYYTFQVDYDYIALFQLETLKLYNGSGEEIPGYTTSYTPLYTDHPDDYFISGKLSAQLIAGNTYYLGIDGFGSGTVSVSAENEPDKSSQITALSPANGSTIDHKNVYALIDFDREVSNAGGNRPELDFNVGTLVVRRASDDKVVYSVKYNTEISLRGSSAPYMTVQIRNMMSALDYDTEYYVTMPEGFIKMADGSVSPAIEKGEWEFQTVVDPTLGSGSTLFEAEIEFKVRDFKDVTNKKPYSQKIAASWNDEWFKNNATTYIKDLAITAIALSGAAYVENKSTGLPIAKPVKTALQDFGFDENKIKAYNYSDSAPDNRHYNTLTEDDNDHVSYTFALKEVENSSGKQIPLVAIIIKGTSGNEEWYSNFNVGEYSPNHMGFDLAKEELLADLENYLESFHVNSNGQIKFFITGHSRGAGVANLVAAELTKSPSLSGHNYRYGSGNVYAYTFAAPAVSTWAVESGYQNIFNIVNEEDFVTRLPLAKWGYKRYGTNLTLPCKSNYGPKYESVYRHMNEEYSSLYGEDHKSYGGSKPVDTAVKDFYEKANTTHDYYHKSWLTLDIFTDDIPLFMTPYVYMHDELCGALLKSFVGLFDFLLDVGGEYAAITRFFSGYKLTGHIFSAHSQVTYYSWLHACSPEELFGVQNSSSYKTFKRLIVKCPVDVYVYDESGTIVASVVNEDIVADKLAVYVDNGEKAFDFPNDQTYSVQVVATDSGSVTYTIEECTVEATDSDVLRTVSFSNIDIKNNDEIVGTINNILFTDNSNYALIKNNADRIYADYDSNNQSPVGPTAPAPSYPSGGNTGGISTPTTYSVTIPNVTGGSVTATPKSAAKDATVTLTVAPSEDFELVSMTVVDSKSNELELADKGNGKYTFTMPASNVTVNATFAPVSSTPTTSTEDPANNDTPYLFPFTDVLKTDWFRDAVEYVFNNDLMSGTAPYTFAPQGKMNRAMVWTVLGRMADADVDGSVSPWYAKAQEWATTNNVSDGTNPNNSISRQELMTMLWRYVGSPAATADLSKFSDNGSVADWANGAMQWAVSTGLIVGDNGRLNPAGEARRCEVATIFMRFCEDIVK